MGIINNIPIEIIMTIGFLIGCLIAEIDFRLTFKK